MGARIWLIAGPTASGKSALALRLARAIGGELVNADSMQLYADLKVLTARPTAEEGAAAPHHLYGVADAAQAWSVGRWLRSALTVIEEIGARDRPAIVVGGTGLYLRALTVGLAPMPPVPAAVREETASQFERLGEAAFRAELAKVDPAAAARIAPGDRQRLTRAAEVWTASGRPLTAWQAQTAPGLAPGSWRGVVLEPARDELYRRCDTRLEAMARGGAPEEVAALLPRNLSPSLPAMKAVGLAAFAAQIRGEISPAEALARAQAATRAYAKRQTTWFRNQASDWPRITALETEAQWEELNALVSPGGKGVLGGR
jgi:tRNA dimethylallyltransferase